MKVTSTKTAVWAACAIALCGATLFPAPAEARRYKKKIVRHHHIERTMPAAAMTPALEDGRHAHLLGGASAVAAPAPMSAPMSAPMPRLSRAARAAYASAQPAAPVSATTGIGSFGGSGGNRLVAQARQYVGATAGQLGVPSRLWCADFMNLVLQKSGHRSSGSRMASSFASYGRRISGPQVGAIAVLSRGKRGGHVGVVSGIDAKGNPIIISGNHGRRVAESTYSRGRVYAYVMPH
jgi:uncharacterized protein (TIGR02594 family)